MTSRGKGNALTCGAGTSVDRDGNISWNMARDTKSGSADQIWFLEKNDDKLYLYNPQSDAYFTGVAGGKTTSLCDKASAPEWKVACVDEANEVYTFNMNGSGQYINSYSATETGLWTGGSSDANNLWTVEEVNTIAVSINSTGYYMGCYPFAIELPEGMEAYVVGEIAESDYEGETYDYAVLDKVDGNVVPARMPVVLVAKSGRHNAKLVAGDNTSYTTPNLLNGTTLRMTGVTRSTALYNVSSSNVAGTKGTVKTTTSLVVPANRAYMFSTDINGITQVYLQTRDVITGISEVESAESVKSGEFYELNGAKAGKLQSGRVYVSSEGKVILVK